MDIKTWLLAPAHLMYEALAALVLADVLCAHSKNPRINHLASALALGIAAVVKATGLAKLPVFGPMLMALLDAIVGPAVVADVVTGKPVVVDPVVVAPTEPPVPPAAA